MRPTVSRSPTPRYCGPPPRSLLLGAFPTHRRGPTGEPWPEGDSCLELSPEVWSCVSLTEPPSCAPASPPLRWNHDTAEAPARFCSACQAGRGHGDGQRATRPGVGTNVAGWDQGRETRTPKLSARRRKAGTQSSNRGMICALGHLV